MMRQPTTRTYLLLLLTLFLAGGYFRHLVDYDNTSSRFFLLSAIVDYGTFAIDPYEKLTMDKSSHDGHYFSNKAVGASFLAVPIYWTLRALPLTRGERSLTRFHRQVVNMTTSAISFALLGGVLFYLGTRMGGDPLTALLMVFAFAFGSIAWVHATMFSGHIMAAAFSFLGFAFLHRLRDEARGPSRPAESGATGDAPDRARYDLLLALAAGLVTGIGALCDYTAIYIALVLTVYALCSRLPPAQKLAFGLGGLLCLTQLLLYNWINFGNLLSLSYAHQTWDEFAAGASQGILGVTLPSVAVLLKLLGSPARGLFFIMPVFVFGVAGLVTLWRKRSDLRAEWWVIVSIVVGYLLINSGFYGWHGGWAHGPRYLVPMLPFLALPMAFAPLRNWLFALAFAASLLRVVPGVIAFPYTPQVILNPLRDTVLPLMRYGYLAENGLFWLGASKVAGIWVGLGVAAVLAALTWWSARANSSMEDAGRGRPSAPSRPLIAVTLILLLGIGAATLAVETERPIRLRVLSRLSDDAGIPLPYRSVGEFLKNAP